MVIDVPVTQNTIAFKGCLCVRHHQERGPGDTDPDWHLEESFVETVSLDIGFATLVGFGEDARSLGKQPPRAAWMTGVHFCSYAVHEYIHFLYFITNCHKCRSFKQPNFQVLGVRGLGLACVGPWARPWARYRAGMGPRLWGFKWRNVHLQTLLMEFISV